METWNVHAVLALIGLILLIGMALGWTVTRAFSLAWCGWSAGERRVIVAMLPRELDTVVMAFLPATTGIAATDPFSLYAVAVLALSVLCMSGALFPEQQRPVEAGATAASGTRHDRRDRRIPSSR